MFNPNLTVKFEDGELIQGVEWKDLPELPIYSMKLKFKDKIIFLSGYKEYNHLIEFVYTILEGQKLIRSIYLMGRTEEYSQVIKMNCITDEITVEQTKYNEEYFGRPCTGWKKGLVNCEPNYEII